MAPRSLLQAATQNARVALKKAKTTTQHTGQKISKRATQAMSLAKQRASKLKSAKTTPSPTPDLGEEDEVISEDQSVGEHEESEDAKAIAQGFTISEDEDGSEFDEELDEEEQPISKREANSQSKRKGRSHAKNEDEDDSGSDGAGNFIIENDQGIAKEPNIFVRNITTGVLSKVYRDPVLFDRTQFGCSKDYSDDKKAKAAEIRNAHAHVDSLAKKQLANDQRAGARSESPADQAARLFKDESDTWEANKRVELAYLAETFTSFDFHKEAQDRNMLPFELEHIKKAKILGYQGNSEFYHDMKANAGFLENASIKNSFINPQIFLDERPNADPTAQDIAKAKEEIEKEDAEDAVTACAEAARAAVEAIATAAGFVGAPNYSNLQTSEGIFKTAYGLDDVSSALQSGFDWEHDDLTMITNGFSGGTRAIALYGVIEDTYEADADGDDVLQELPDEGYGTASNRESREISEANDSLSAGAAATLPSAPVLAKFDTTKDHTTEIIHGRKDVFARLAALSWDERQILVSTQRYHGDYALAFLVGKTEGMKPNPVNATQALDSLVMSLQSAKKEAGEDSVFQNFHFNIMPMYEELVASQGLTVQYERDPEEFDLARAARIATEEYYDRLLPGKGNKSEPKDENMGPRASKPKPAARLTAGKVKPVAGQKRKANDEASDMSDLDVSNVDASHGVQQDDEPRPTKKLRAAPNEAKPKAGRGRPAKPVAEKAQAKKPRAPRKTAAVKREEAAAAAAAVSEAGSDHEGSPQQPREQVPSAVGFAAEPKKQTATNKRKRDAGSDDNDAAVEGATVGPAKKPRITKAKNGATDKPKPVPKPKAARKPKPKTKKQLAAEAKQTKAEAIARVMAQAEASGFDVNNATADELHELAVQHESQGSGKAKAKANATEDVAAEDLATDELQYRQSLAAAAALEDEEMVESSEEE